MTHPLPTLAQIRAEHEIVKYNFDLQTIEFGEHFYNAGMVSNLVEFLMFMVKESKFKLIVEGREFTVRVQAATFKGWMATTTEYDGPEDKINSEWSEFSKENALEGLIEKLQGAILEKENMTKREIKYRTWDADAKTMCGPYDITDAFFNHKESRGSGNGVLLQFTGLLDKSGKEIYEGDIIHIEKSHHWDALFGYFKVDFTHGYFAIFDCEGSLVEQLWNCHQASEVIGNIYEHPELLSGEQKEN